MKDIKQEIKNMEEENQQTLDWSNWINRFNLLRRILK